MSIFLPTRGSYPPATQEETKKATTSDLVTLVGREVTVHTRKGNHPLDTEKCRQIYEEKMPYNPGFDDLDMDYYELLLQLKKGVKWRAELIQKHGDPLKITQLFPRQQEIWKKAIKEPFNEFLKDKYGLKADLTIYSTCRHDPRDLVAQPIT
jgi:hypothetical protein